MSQILVSNKLSIPHLVFAKVFLITLAASTVFGQLKLEAETTQLILGQAVERNVMGEETHAYSIMLDAGQYLHVRVNQKGVDVVISLFDSSSKMLVSMDSLNGKHGVEPLSFISETSGNYRLEVHSSEKTSNGRYEIIIKELRAANKKDKSVISAQQAKGEGIQLYVKRTTESLQGAIKKFEEALEFYRAGEDRDGEATMLSYIVSLYGYFGAHKKKLSYLNQLLQLNRSLEDKYSEATTLYQIGALQFSLGEYQNALDNFAKAVEIFQIGGHKLDEGNVFRFTGSVYYMLGENQKALEEFTKALTLFRTINNPAEEGRILESIGGIYLDKGENEKAIQYFNQSLEKVRSVKDEFGEARTLRSIGTAYLYLGEDKNALEYYQQALLLNKSTKDKIGEGQTLHNIGAVFHNLGDKQKALEYLNQALEARRSTGVKMGESATLHLIGAVYHDLGKKQKALDYYNQSLQISKEIDDKRGEAATLRHIGAVYHDLRDKHKAIDYYNQSLALSRMVEDKRGEAKTLNELRNTWSALNNPRVAIFYGKQAVNTYQELRRNIKGLDKKTQETYLKSVEPIYRKLISILIDEGRIGEAEQILAILKESELFDYLRRDEKVAKDLLQTVSLTQEEQETLKRYEQHADKITQYGKEFADLEKQRNSQDPEDFFPNLARYNELKNLLNDARVVFQKFLDQLQLKTPNGQGDKRIAEVKLLQDKLQLLKTKKTAVVSTIIDKDRLNIIVTTANTQVPHTIPITEKEINVLVAEFRQSLMNRAVDPRPTGQKLYDILVKPIEADLNGIKADTIVWSLDGTLRYVPTAALWDEKIGYLAQKYANVVLTLASLDKIIQPISDQQFWKALGVGVSKSIDGFEELPAVAEELDCIIKDEQTNTASADSSCSEGIFEGKKLLNEKFTINAFKDSLSKFPLIHIASHFSLRPGTDKDSFLLLGEGEKRRFTIEDLRSVKLTGVELLVLSACNTATPGGEKANGLEVEAFAAIAQELGVKSVIASLWSVADAPTKEFMVEFYRQFVSGQENTTKAIAIKNVQKAMIEGKIRLNTDNLACRSEVVILNGEKQTPFNCDAKAPLAHPFYWSPFILIGNWK